MRKLFTAITVLGVIFWVGCLTLNAQKGTFEMAVFISDYSVYDQDYFDTNSTFRMVAAVRVNTSEYPVYISSEFFEEDYSLHFLQDWSEYTYALAFYPDQGAPAPGEYWEQGEYQFYVDENDNQSREPSEAVYNLNLPLGSIQKLAIPSQVEVTGTKQPKLSWQAVEEADFYRVRLIQEGWKLVDESEFIPDDGSEKYSYEYKGKAFEENSSNLALVIEAYDTLNDDLESQIINRSRYVTQFSSEKCASLSSDLSIFVPCLQFQEYSYWAEFEYAGKDSKGNLLWKLKDLGEN